LSDEIRREPPPDPELSEYWVRLPVTGTHPHLRKVWVKHAHDGLWQVDLAAREYFREDPVGLELARRIDRALLSVPGVISARNRSWETWNVTGTPTGEALCQAAANVVDDLASQMNDAWDDEYGVESQQ